MGRMALSKAPVREALTAVALLALTTAAAQAQVTISIGNGTISNVGGTTTVDISISGIPQGSSVTAIDLDLTYMSSKATATGVQKIGVASSCEDPSGNEGSPGVFSIGFTCITHRT